jgi:PIN domain nuclease of toxin-antitoxin system
VIILDTHTWIWWETDPARLGRRGHAAIKRADRRGVAAISCWEIAMLVGQRRIRLDRGPVEWMEQSLDQSGIDLLPLAPAVAVRAEQIGGGIGADPGDRLIAATALVYEAMLVTMDENMRAFESLRTVW